MKLIMKNNKDRDSSLLGWAIQFASMCHEQQFDLQGDFYFHHVARVAGNVALKTQDPDILIAAWLHDVWKDCQTIEIGRIKKIFGAEVARLICLLTRAKEEETYFQYIDRVKTCPKATLIKQEDLWDNLTRCSGFFLALENRYRKALDILSED